MSSHPFWSKDKICVYGNLKSSQFVFDEEKHYKWQLDKLSNALLVDDYSVDIEVNIYAMNYGFFGWTDATKLSWLNKGELVSGSFIVETLRGIFNLGQKLEYSDIDIYFKCKEDAAKFCEINQIYGINFAALDNPMCAYASHNGQAYNLIWGVEYQDPKSLIGKFDIRACSVAFCPQKNEFHTLDGATDDIALRRIVFNPVPRGVSLRRLIKYVEKDFSISSHQRVFFTELLRTHLYSAELELNTKDY